MYSHRSLLETFTDSTGFSTGHVIVAVPSNPAFGAFAVEIGDMDDFAALNGAFDQYRIDLVDIYIKPRANSFQMHGTVSPFQSNPTLFAVVDRDDATTPTSIAQLRQYDNCIEASPYEGLHFRFKPSVTPSYYATGSFVGYGVDESQWLDVASSAIPHYGVKWAVEALQATSTDEIWWDVECYIHSSWKSSR
jgi:hypothetical protein